MRLDKRIHDNKLQNGNGNQPFINVIYAEWRKMVKMEVT